MKGSIESQTTDELVETAKKAVNSYANDLAWGEAGQWSFDLIMSCLDELAKRAKKHE